MNGVGLSALATPSKVSTMPTANSALRSVMLVLSLPKVFVVSYSSGPRTSRGLKYSESAWLHAECQPDAPARRGMCGYFAMSLSSFSARTLTLL